jgi:hypothetical protein
VPSLSDRISEANQRGVEFLLVELDTALMFLKVARTANSQTGAQHTHRQALAAAVSAHARSILSQPIPYLVSACPTHRRYNVNRNEPT